MIVVSVPLLLIPVGVFIIDVIVITVCCYSSVL